MGYPLLRYRLDDGKALIPSQFQVTVSNMVFRFAIDFRRNLEAFRKPLWRLLRDEAGQDLIEYALVAALVGLGAVASMKTLSTKIGTAFTTIGTSLTSNV